MTPIPPNTELPKQYDIYPFIDSKRFVGKLKRKVVVVTGASSGIGKAAALALAATGASAACVARRKNLLEDLVTEIKHKHNFPTTVIEADLCETAKAKRRRQSRGRIIGSDILCKNAENQQMGHMADYETFDEWWSLYDILHKASSALIQCRLAVDGCEEDWHSSQCLQHIRLLRYSLDHGRVAPDTLGVGPLLEHVSPDILRQLGSWSEVNYQSVELVASSLVAACADERFKVMTGRYIDAEQDLEEVVEVTETGWVEKENLYYLRVDEV